MSTVAETLLDFYRHPRPMTSAGRYASLFDQLPDDVSALARVVQGLAIHEFAADWYGVSISEQRQSESHIRPVEQMVERILVLDDRPLSVARPPEKRLVGVCHHFMLLLLAMLRTKGIPARGQIAGFSPIPSSMRCGAGSSRSITTSSTSPATVS